MPNREQFKTHKEYLNWYRDYREKNREKLLVYWRKYNSEYRKKNGYHNEANSKARYPEKEKARMILGQAIKVGYIERESCRDCDKKGQAHHPDYSKPLDVIWLCPIHHAKEHKRLINT